MGRMTWHPATPQRLEPAGPDRDCGAGAPRRTRRAAPASDMWKPVPVGILHTFVTYQGYDSDMDVLGYDSDMDVLSGDSYDVMYPRCDTDIPNANNLEWHIPVIYFLSFGQIVYYVIYVGYPNHRYF